MDAGIRFTVQGTEEAENSFRKLQESSQAMARDMIRSSRQYSTSGKEVLEDIERQIKALERKARLESQVQRSVIRQDVAAGAITKEESQVRFADVQEKQANLELQNQLLRDIIQSIKDASRDEIRQDRAGVEESIRSDVRLTRLGIRGDEDEFDALRRTIQRQELGEVQEEEAIEEERAGRGPSSRRTAQIGGAFIGRNEYVAIASLFTLIPMIGEVLSTLGQQALGAAMAYETGMGANVARTGGYQGRYAGFGAGSTQFGYTMAESLRLREQAVVASGQNRSVSQITDLQMLQRGLGLDQGLLMSMERAGREDISGLSTRDIAASTVSALRSTGAIEGENMALLPEYLQQLVDLGQQQLSVAGRIDSGVNVKTVAAISGLDETFKSPAVLRGMMSSIQSGLSNAPSEFSGALQLSALSRMDPNASLWELEKMRENPLARGTGYLSSMLGMLQGASGGDEEMFYRNIYAQGLAPSRALAERLGRGFMAGNLEDVIGQDGFGFDLAGRARRATPELTRATSVVENRMAQLGELLIEKIQQLNGIITDLIKEEKAKQGDTKSYYEIAESIDKSAESMDRASKAMSNFSATLLRLGPSAFK